MVQSISPRPQLNNFSCATVPLGSNCFFVFVFLGGGVPKWLTIIPPDNHFGTNYACPALVFSHRSGGGERIFAESPDNPFPGLFVIERPARCSFTLEVHWDEIRWIGRAFKKRDTPSRRTKVWALALTQRKNPSMLTTSGLFFPRCLMTVCRACCDSFIILRRRICVNYGNTKIRQNNSL